MNLHCDLDLENNNLIFTQNTHTPHEGHTQTHTHTHTEARTHVYNQSPIKTVITFSEKYSTHTHTHTSWLVNIHFSPPLNFPLPTSFPV